MKKIEINNPLVILGTCSWMLFLFLAIRNTGLYPTVFADELIYSNISRLHPLGDSPVPGYLYLKLYSITNYCGDGFLGCAKLINSVLFVSAIPFIYLISRRVTGEGVSAFVSLLSVIGPINSYTAYFMPESFYFLSFWVFCWYLLSLSADSEKWRWILAGAIYAISALIKPHSIFFLPTILIYISFIFFRGRYLSSKQAALVVSSFILGALLTKFGLSYILAGSAGLTIFGSTYGSIAASTVSSGTEKYIQILLLALEAFKGHLLVLALVYGLPFALAVAVSANALFVRNNQAVNSGSQAAQYEKISFLSLLVILNLVCVSALFTASVANSGPYETPYRLHMRSYNFALPLFYVIAAGALSAVADVKKLVRYILGGIFVVLGFYTIWTNFAPYAPSYIDSPEIRGLHVSNLYFQVIGGLLISTLVLWVFIHRKGLQLYLYLALPLFVVVSTYHVGLEMNNRLKLDVYDKAGIFTKHHLTNEDLSKALIVGSEDAGLTRSLFYLDNAKASRELIQKGADYDLAKLPAGKEWILVIGGHEITGIPLYQIPMNGFALIRASKDDVVDFKKGAWPGIILKTMGLSTPESWGTWSQSDIVEFKFARPLPSRFEIHLVAHAFGPNVDSEFVASVGESTTKFTLAASVEQKIIRLENPTGSNILRVKIPNAVSPKNLGLSGDDRNLGIAFIEMKIVASQ